MNLVSAILAVVLGLIVFCNGAPASDSASARLPNNARVSHPNIVPLVPHTFTIDPSNQPDETFIAALNSDPVAVAALFAANEMSGVNGASIRVSSSHASAANVTHVYLQQFVHGLRVFNGVGNINMGPGCKVLSAGESYFKGGASVTAPAIAFTSKLNSQDAVLKLAKFLDLSEFHRRKAPELVYIQMADSSVLRLGWDAVLDTADSLHVYNGVVDAETGSIHFLNDWVSDASYNVFPFPTGVSPDAPGGRKLVVNPANKKASPDGWHELASHNIKFTDTRGNNVFAQDNPGNNPSPIPTTQHRPDGGENLVFDFPLDLTKDPSMYRDAAITNLFYWCNTMHDLTYQYGFNPASGNFQLLNPIGKGNGLDPVIAYAQDGGGTNNANFLTPPDGTPGVMRMYVWDGWNPHRDGDLESGIIVHEYMHGVSTRLTGGPTNVNCLAEPEAGGMGEGWGDTVATVIRTTSSDTRASDFRMGEYVIPGGIRNFPYSTSLETNPSTYGFLAKNEYMEVHNIGEVWAVILYEVYWNLVDEFEFEPNWFKSESQRGNIVFLWLLLTGMKLQPCNPNFVSARDAILQADEILYDGDHTCDIWKGFAKRGVGVKAEPGTYTNGAWGGKQDFGVPEGC